MIVASYQLGAACARARFDADFGLVV